MYYNSIEAQLLRSEAHIVADHLSRACSVVVLDCAYSVTVTKVLLTQQLRRACAATCVGGLAHLVAASAWPEQAGKQSELDSVACEVCDH